MSISYNFLALPQDTLNVLYQKHLTGNQLLVLLAISEEVLKYPEGRASLTRELACRYIAEKINISFQAVSRAIRKLVSIGLISVIEVGKKYVGSILKLNIGATSETRCVIPGETQEENSVVSCRTNKRTNTKKCLKEQTTVAAVVSQNSSSKNLCSEENTSNQKDTSNNKFPLFVDTIPEVGEKNKVSICPEKINIFGREVNNTIVNSYTEKGIVQTDTIKDTNNILTLSDDLSSTEVVKSDLTTSVKVVSTMTPPLPQEEFKELLPMASGLGIKPALLSTGIKTLASRECHNLKSTLQDIFSQIKSRAAAIKKVPAYFVSLCSNIEFEASVPTALNNGSNAKEFSTDGPTSTISTASNDTSGGFRPVPENFLSGCSSPLPVELSPVDILKQKRKDFADKISSGFRIGAIKYVLSPSGISQPIITCSSDGFSYLKEGHLRNAYWNELPEKLLNEVFFVGDEYLTELEV